MVLEVQENNDVKVYNVSSSKSVPEWAASKKRSALRYDQGASTSLSLPFLSFPFLKKI